MQTLPLGSKFASTWKWETSQRCISNYSMYQQGEKLVLYVTDMWGIVLNSLSGPFSHVLLSMLIGWTTSFCWFSLPIRMEILPTEKLVKVQRINDCWVLVPSWDIYLISVVEYLFSYVKMCCICLCCSCLTMLRCVEIFLSCLPKAPEWSNKKLNNQ